MESLLCNEVWPMSPSVVLDAEECKLRAQEEEESRQVFVNFVAKEERFLPEPGYLKILLTNDFVSSCRFKAVTWLLEFRERSNISIGTVFIAVNCLDRFVSLSQCQGWKDWMFEMLSVACLSVAAKFNETSTFSLCEFQEGLNRTYAPSSIQRMELTLLKGLGWRIASTTSFSYIELLMQSVNVNLVEDYLMTPRVVELLINTLLDPKFLEFRPSVIAMSAVRCFLENLCDQPICNTASLALMDVYTVIFQDQKDDLSKCQKSIAQLQTNVNIFCGKNSFSGPSSPVTVFNFSDCPDGRPLNIDARSSQKRKREEMEC